MKIKLEDEPTPVEVTNVWKHYSESDEHYDYTVDFIRDNGGQVMRWISREEYLRICKLKGWDE